MKWDVFTELSPPPLPLPELQEGAACAALTIKLEEEECDYFLKAHARSNLQHKYESFYGGTRQERFLTSWHISCLAWTYVIFLTSWLWKTPEALGDSFECVLKGVGPAGGELMCSTEQCCTEYLWHWNSCELLCHHRCLGKDLPSRLSCVRTHSQICTSCLGGPLPPLLIKAQTHVANTWRWFKGSIMSEGVFTLYEATEGWRNWTTHEDVCKMCVCVRLCARQSMCMCVHKCASPVFLCVHIYAQCFGLYMPMCMSQTSETGGWVRLSLWNFEVMWCLCTTCLPLLFVLIPERFT